MKNLKVVTLIFLLQIAFFSTKTVAQQLGYACLYSKNLCGQRVSSGKKLNCAALTAAHRTLKFGTVVRITNLDNNESVLVEINDRGPFTKKYLVDLTPAAARRIGLNYGNGRVRIRLDIVIE